MNKSNRDDFMDSTFIHFCVIINLLLLSINFYSTGNWILGTYVGLVFISCLIIKLLMIGHLYTLKGIWMRFKVYTRTICRSYRQMPILYRILSPLLSIVFLLFTSWILLVITGVLAVITLVAFPVVVYFFFDGKLKGKF